MELGSLDHSGIYRELTQVPGTEDLYVNFMWFEKDFNTNYVYALLGNENAPDALNSRIYMFDAEQS